MQGMLRGVACCECDVCSLVLLLLCVVESTDMSEQEEMHTLSGRDS